MENHSNILTTETPRTVWLGRTDAEAEAPVLWPPDAKNWLIGKDPGPGKDWRQKQRGTTKDGIISSTDSMDVELKKLWEQQRTAGRRVLQSMRSQESNVT